MQMSVKASFDALPLLLDRLDNELALLGLNTKSRSPILLSTDEIFSNIVMHGQLDDNNDVIKLKVFLKEDYLYVDIIDSGPPFDPTSPASADATAETLNEVQVGGWGLMIVNTLAESVEYIREEGSNRIRMQFPLTQPSGDAEPST